MDIVPGMMEVGILGHAANKNHQLTCDGPDRSSWFRSAVEYVRENRWLQVLVYFAVWFLVWMLGMRGYLDQQRAEGGNESILQALYLSLQLFVLESGGMEGNPGTLLQIARFLAPLFTVSTAIGALIAIFYDQVRLGLLRFHGNHVIICGLGRIGILMVKGHRSGRNKRSVVVIEKDESNDNIPLARDMGAIVLIGEAADPKMLRRAWVQFADILIVASGIDGTNAEIAFNAREQKEKHRGSVLTCFVHIVDLQLFDLLIENAIMKTRGVGKYFRLALFNVHSAGAQEMLTDHPPFTPAMRYPRIVVLGLGQFGQAVVVEAAIRWRLRNPESDRKLRIDVIDKLGKSRLDKLKRLYPFIVEYCDVRVEDLDVEMAEFQGAEFLSGDVNELPEISAIYICFDNDSIGLASALSALKAIRADERNIPIIIRTNRDRGIASLLEGGLSGMESGQRMKKFKNLYAFELFNRTCRPGLLIGFTEDLAREFHEGYRAHVKETDGRIDPGWDDLEEVFKLSNRRQAVGMPRVLALAGFDVEPCDTDDEGQIEFTEEEIETISALEHERWVSDRMRDGWRYGETTDKKKKIHSELVPWKKVPGKSQDINRAWVRRLPAVLMKFKRKIRRTT